MDDADVPGWWQRLGLPGLIDIHTHFMPKPVMDAVWRYFDNAAEHYGTSWPVQYRGTDDERVAQLRALGVRRFTALVYPHKPGNGRVAERVGAGVRGTHARVRADRNVLSRALGRVVRAGRARRRDRGVQGARAGRRFRPAR